MAGVANLPSTMSSIDSDLYAEAPVTRARLEVPEEALDALQALRSMGLDVPRDVLLAGFDDAAESRRCMPQLTTIHIHTQIMAYTAVQLLRVRIEEPELDYCQVYTETELILRASTERP